MANGDAGDMPMLNSAQRKLMAWLYQLHTNGFIGGKTISVGRNEARLVNYAHNEGIELASGHLYISPKSIAHTFRPLKIEKGIAIDDMAIINFVKDKRHMDLFWDGDAFIYTDYINKFIVKPNHEIKINRKKTRKVSYVTAERVEHPEEFTLPKYKRVSN